MKVYKESDFALPPNPPRGGGGALPYIKSLILLPAGIECITYPFIFSTLILPVVIYKNLY